jgi:NitT/TauT family transport system substrate-binding protein
MRRPSSSLKIVAALAVGAVALAACGSSGSGSSSSTSTAATTSASAGGGGSADASTTAASSGGDTGGSGSPAATTPANTVQLKVSIAALGNLIHAPFYVGLAEGFYLQQGLDLQVTPAGGGANTGSIVLSGQMPIGVDTSDESIRLSAQGQSLPIAVPLTQKLGQELVVSKAALQSKGVTDDMSINDKIKKLTGLKLGVTSPGSSTDNAIRYLYKSAGLDPDKDISIVALGGAAALNTAFKSGKIDGFSAGPPTSTQNATPFGNGEIVASYLTGDVPALADIVYTVIDVNADWAKANPAMLNGLDVATLKALDFIAKNPDKAAADIHTKYFSSVPDAEWAASWKAMLPSFPTLDTVNLDQKSFDTTATNFLSTIDGKPLQYNYSDVALPDQLKTALAQVKSGS